MARTNLTINLLSRTAPVDWQTLEQTPDAVDDAMFQNDGKTMLYVRNTGVGAHVLTFPTPQTVAGLAVADQTITIAAAKYTIVGPWPTETFNQQSGADTAKCYVNVDGTKTEMRYVAFRLP